MKTLQITFLQMDSMPERRINLSRVGELAAGKWESDIIVLPEAFSCRGNDDDYIDAAEDPGKGPSFEALSRLARENNSWVIGGSIMERDKNRIFKTTIALNRSGELAAIYRKIHLFSLYEAGNETVMESRVCSPGTKPVMIEIEKWQIGLSICFDLRFPGLYQRYRLAGCDLILAPSDFTAQTGKDHWHVLTRARAIENQCFLIAPGQCGMNRKTGVESYGHSIAIDPWGNILAEAGREETTLFVEINHNMIEQARLRVPMTNKSQNC